LTFNFFSLSGLIVLADQITKPIVRTMVPLHESIPIVPGLLALTHVQNRGAAFGILNRAEFPFKTPILIAVSVAALGLIGLYATQLPHQQRLARVGLVLVLGGAVGNLIDRIRLGYVLDFVDVYWRNYHFWAFNVADAAITIGVAAVVLDLLLERGGKGASHPL